MPRDPRRIQRRRTKGWRMPEGAVYVGRAGVGSGQWGNPFYAGGWFKRGDANSRYLGPFRMMFTQRAIWQPGDEQKALREGFALIADAAQAVEWYRWYATAWSAQMQTRCRHELRGHDLACLCGLCPAHRDGRPLGIKCDACAPCHADVLLEIANAP